VGGSADGVGGRGVAVVEGRHQVKYPKVGALTVNTLVFTGMWPPQRGGETHIS
jgi:hypothetical protein